MANSAEIKTALAVLGSMVEERYYLDSPISLDLSCRPQLELEGAPGAWDSITTLTNEPYRPRYKGRFDLAGLFLRQSKRFSTPPRVYALIEGAPDMYFGVLIGRTAINNIAHKVGLASFYAEREND